MRRDSTTPLPAILAEPGSTGGTCESREDSVVIDRTDAMLRMMALGMALDEIEQQLDWLDAQARLSSTTTAGRTSSIAPKRLH